MRYNIFSYHDNDFLNIDNIGYSNDTKVTKFGPGKRELYIVHYVISGKGYFNGNAVNEGQGFLIYPNMWEHYYSDLNNPWSFLWIVSEDDNMEKLFQKYNVDKTTNIFTYNNFSHILNLKDKIISNNNKFYSSTEIIEDFLTIFNSNVIKNNIFETSEDIYYNYSLKYIQSNIFRKISVCELADILGISSSYLYKIFVKKCGVSPQKYILNLKIEKAKQLLKENNMTIMEISNSLGYDDALSFSKFFKKYVGKSPKFFKND